MAGMLVVLYHLGGAFGADKYFGDSDLQAWTSWGHYSVIFFFVLSGFTMVRAHHGDFAKPDRLLTYLRKRAIRVYPAYLLVLLTVYASARFVPSLTNAVPHDFWVMLKTALLFPQDRLVVGGTGAPVLIVAWSMQYEIVFYLLIGCFIGGKWLGGFAVTALLVNYVACKFESTCSFPRAFFASNFVLPFFFGAVAALVSVNHHRFREPLRVAAAAACIISFIRGLDVVYHINATLLADGTLVYGLLSAVLVVALVNAEDTGRIKLSDRWGSLAASGYALYLLHFPLISLLCKLALMLQVRGVLAIRLTFVAIFICCVIAAQLFYRFVERPMVSCLLNLGRSRVPEATNHAAAQRHEIITSGGDNADSSTRIAGALHDRLQEQFNTDVQDVAVANSHINDVADSRRGITVFHR